MKSIGRYYKKRVRYLRILLLSNVPLRKDNSMGNTLLNLFGELEDIELANIYTRNGIPDIEISEAFCITERMIISSLFQKCTPGKKVDNVDGNQRNTNTKEHGIVRFMRVHRWTIFFWLQNLTWRIGKWKSAELKQFVEKYDPDVVVAVFLNLEYLNRLLLHTLSLTNAKLVLCAWDNNYSLKQFYLSPFRWIRHFIDRIFMRKVVRKADLFYVISEIQKRDYEKYFGKTCRILTKGADFAEPPDFKEQHHVPLQLVFTGNIAMNRWKSLKMIADVLENINQDGVKAQLCIYTTTPLTRKMKRDLNRGKSSFLKGSVPSDRIAEIQKNADLLVHVEAMDLENRLLVRQSFSTKIVDYMKAARPILAVGPKEVASMDHLVKNDCAIVAENEEELDKKLRSVLANPSELKKLVENAYACGFQYHNKQNIEEMLLQDLHGICGI